MERLFGDFSGLMRKPEGVLAAGTPLIVAIHGGTYTSAYFDMPGYSLLDRAAANGCRLSIAHARLPSFGIVDWPL